jgi:HEAT repeat protein
MPCSCSTVDQRGVHRNACHGEYQAAGLHSLHFRRWIHGTARCAAAALGAMLVAACGCQASTQMHEQDVSKLVAMLAEADPARRVQGAYALGQLGTAAEVAVPQLVAALADEHPRVRQTAVVSLGQIGPGAKAGVPALVVVLEKSDDNVLRRQAAAALGRIGPNASAALPALRKASQDKSRIVREAALEAVEQIGN